MLQKFLIKNLIQNTIHLGHKKNLRNQKTKNLILGSRNNIDILNLNITILNLLKIIPLLKQILLNNQTFLCITNKKKRNIKYQLPIIYENWLPGNLTNYKNLKKLKKKNFQLSQFPKTIILLTYQKTYAISKESNLIKIPLISLIDTNAENKNTIYTIPSNDNSITSENYFLKILQYIYLISYIEKLKKFSTKKISFIKNFKKTTSINKYIFQKKNIFKYKKKKYFLFKNKNLKNIIKFSYSKINKFYKFKNYHIKNSKIITKTHTNKKYKYKKNILSKKIKKFKLNTITTKYYYKLPRLDSNQ